LLSCYNEASMKSTTRVSNQLLRIICIIGFLSAPAHSQINQIDPSKLPQDAPVQSAYQSLLPIEQYARTYESTWRFPISKSDMAGAFRSR
jgi:hypothetical protein